MSVTVRTKDLGAFEEATGWDGYLNADDAEEGEQFVQINIDEVNYGGDDELEAAAKAGIPFYGYHSAGGCYGAMLFAALGGKTLWQDCDSDGYPTVRFDLDTGGSERADMCGLKKFVEFYKAAKAAVERKELPNGDSV